MSDPRRTRHATAFVLCCAVLTTLYMTILATQAAAQPRGAISAGSRQLSRAISMNVERLIKPRLTIARGAAGPVTAIAMSPDERSLLTAMGDGGVRLWDLRLGRQIASLRGPGGVVTMLDIAPNGSRAVATSAQGRVTLYELDPPAPGRTLPMQAQVGAFIDDRTLLLGTPQGELSQVTTDGRLVNSVAMGGVVEALAVDAGMAVALLRGGRARAMELADGAVIPLGDARATGATAVALDGDTAVVGYADGAVRSFQARTGRLLTEVRGVLGAAVTALAASSGVVTAGDDQGRVMVVRGGSGRLLSGPAGSVAVSHEGGVTGAVVDAAGDFALSSSKDNTVWLWSLRAGTMVLRLISTRDGWTVVDADGRFDGAQDSLTGVEWRAPEAVIPIQNFSREYYEPSLLARTMQGARDLAPVRPIEQGVHLPPLVEIALEGNVAESGPPEVLVEVAAVEQGRGGVSQLRLFQNGRRVSESRRVSRETETQRGATVIVERYRTSLAAGANIFTATAENKQKTESVPARASLAGRGATGAPTLWMVTVGVNQYSVSSLNLNYAKPDANALSTFFDALPGRLFSQGRGKTLVDGQATKPAVLQAVRSLRSAAIDDVVVIYLAGHGEARGASWSFITHDGQRLDAAELQREIDALPAQRIFIALDTCYSGRALPPPSHFAGLKSLRLLAWDMGVHILAATDRDQEAIELSQLGHGVFTYALLQALRGGADDAPGDGVVSVREVLGYVENNTPMLGERFAGRAQFPTAHSRGADFGLARR